MVAKKIVRFHKSSFSYSVVVAILASAGIAVHGYRACGSETSLDLLVEHPSLSSEEPSLVTETILELDLKEEEDSNYSITALTQGSSGINLDLTTSSSLAEFQHLTNEPTLYTLKDELSWSDVDTQSHKDTTPILEIQPTVDSQPSSDSEAPINSEKDSEKDKDKEETEGEKQEPPKEPSSNKEVSEDTNSNTQPHQDAKIIKETPKPVDSNAAAKNLFTDVSQGLAFCYKNKAVSIDQPQQSSGPGIMFSGIGPKAALIFKNLKASKAGAAIYSDADVIFKNLTNGLCFNMCESLEHAGAVAGQNIMLKKCGNIVFTACKSDSTLVPLNTLTDFMQGGGALNACGNAEGTSTISDGKLLMIGNVGSILMESNSARNANGGAIACREFICDSNEGVVTWEGNRALSGGAISSEGNIKFLRNVGSLKLSGNEAIVEVKEIATDFLGGGACAAKQAVLLKNNADIHCVNNTSKSYGGAILANEIVLSETVNEAVFKHNTAALFGGAFSVKNKAQIGSNFGSVVFEDNQTHKRGGAIYCGIVPQSEKAKQESIATGSANIEICDNTGAITFLNNQAAFSLELMTTVESYAGGGGLWTDNVLLARNSGEITFTENIGGSDTWVGEFVGGGAIFVTNKVIISNNNGDISFIRNCGQALARELPPAPKIIPNPEDVSVAPDNHQLNPKDGEASHDNVSPENVASLLFLRDSRGPFYIHAVAEEEAPQVEPEVIQTELSSLLDIRGGGAILGHQIDITHNEGTLLFSKNIGGGAKLSIPNVTAVVGGGALLAVDGVKIQNNRAIIFKDNVTPGIEDSGGAILAKDVYIEGNAVVEFASNGSSCLGGAICAMNNAVNIVKNHFSIVFSNNKTQYGGGAIAAPKGAVLISENTGKIEFKDNILFGDVLQDSQIGSQRKRYGGGAVFAKTAVDIKNNINDLIFIGNRSNAFGGAIFVGSLDDNNEEASLTMTGNRGDVFFVGNSTLLSNFEQGNHCGGGAIYTQNLKIAQNDGIVVFYNNKASRGAAIGIAEKGVVILEAFGGDVIFEGNTNFDGNSDAIYLFGKNSKISELSAATGTNLIFRDAIDCENLHIRDIVSGESNPLDNPSLIFNVKPIGKDSLHHEGAVKFARAISKIPQIAVIQEGTLALSEGAQLWLGGIKQEAGSVLLLSAGTVLRIFENVVEPILTEPTTVNNSETSLESPEHDTRVEGVSSRYALSTNASTDVTDVAAKPLSLVDISSVIVDLSSFVPGPDASLPSAPEIVVPKGIIVGSGNIELKLADSTNIGYENHALLSTEKEISLLTFKTADSITATPVVDPTLSDIKIDVALPSVTESTYGHTGVWSEAQVKDGKLVIGWQPTGYRLNPEKHGDLVLNTLWSHFVDLQALKQEQFSHHIISQRMELDFSTNIWGSVLGVFSNCASISNIDGFTHRAGGYAMGLDTQLVEDFLLGGCFAQFLGKTESKIYTAHSEQKKCYLGSVYAGILTGPWLFKGTVIYGNLNNDLTTTYSTLGSSTASWVEQGCVADIRVDYRYIVNPRRFMSAIISTVVPFIEVEYIRIDLPKIHETGKEVRTFQKTRLENVGIPIGMVLEHGYSRGLRSEVNGLSIAYIFDVYRKDPKSMITLPEASYSWEGKGMDVSRKAVKAQFSNDTEWNSYLSTHLGFNYEWREHLITYDVNGGIRLIF
ncbi:autotransporter domain-containing protein [Candidatus Chlamydia sanziniae]|uniref:Polymorphic membrane protein D family n=1 Tax=Candidatus Chlamydia sanziniae TaxID=1806891 RepID=A0A1A9HXV5_9CHLA|nr:polymorphic outer membrane protein middle domain-containing protein [Candidatus Chlamydia sanziniae]ANH78756.1 polymorphic membrane protein D family [Candidatus Chlamydia sanziniae]